MQEPMSVICGGTLGGRFGRLWADEANSDEDEGSDEDSPARKARSIGSPSLSYLHVPEDGDRSLGSRGSAAHLRREEKRRLQREAATFLRSGTFSSSTSDQTSPAVSSRPARRTNLRLPVLSPSSFILQNYDAAEWVLIQRKKRKSSFESKKNHRQCRFGSPPVRFRSPFPFPFENSEVHDGDRTVGHMGCGSDIIFLEKSRGQMGLDHRIMVNPPGRLTRFISRSRPSFLGLHRFGVAPIVPPFESAAAMAHRGGGQNRGRGPPGGRGGGRWEGGNGGRGNNFFQGGPSGTAGDGDNSHDGADHQADVFSDGVFRAGQGRPNFNGNGNRYAYGNTRGDGRRQFGGGGNFNNRRYGGYGDNNRYFGDGRNNVAQGTANALTPMQQQLVKEAAVVLARQLAEQQGPSAVGSGASAAPLPQVEAARQGAANVRPPPAGLRQTVLPSRPAIVATVQQPAAGTSVEVGAVGAEDVSLAAAGVTAASAMTADNQQSKKKGPNCFRCKQPGHCLNDCITPLCDYCQSAEHLSKDCALLRAPRPRLAHFGLGHEDLSFWELPLSASVRPRIENTRMGRVTISGGVLTVPEIIAQLQWIVPDESYQWDVQLVEDNTFRVTFPSKVDLVRVQHFGRYNLPNSQISMSFDFWKREVEPAWTAEDIWVRVHDLPPRALDDFLALWAIGDIFGKTKEIDMAFTRSNNVLRILIVCLDPSLIPASLDLRIHNAFYRLRFEVEGVHPLPMADAVMDDVPKDDDGFDGNGSGGADGNDPDREVKRMKNGDQNDTNGNDEQKTPAPSQGNTLSMSPIKLGSLDGSLLLQDELNHTWVDMTAQENIVTRYDNVLLLNNNSFSSPKKLDFSFCSSSPGTGEFVPSSSAEVSSDDDINLTHVSPTADVLEGVRPAADAPLPTVHDEETTPSLPAVTLGCSPSIQLQVRPVVHGTNSSPAQLQPSMHGAAELATSITWSSPPITVAPPAVATLAAQPWSYPPAPYVAAPLMPNTCFPQSQCAPLVGAPWGFNAQTSHVMKSTDASGVRSSERIRAQPNSDATQMERAMLMAQRRDDNAYHGYSASCALDSLMGVPSPGGAAGAHGFGCNRAVDGCSGSLFPGYRMATH
nr:uncharacterized protein LOC127334860 [Lolium perenne]